MVRVLPISTVSVVQSHLSRDVPCWGQPTSENSLSPEREENATVHAASMSPHCLFGTIYHDVYATMTLVVNNFLAIWSHFCSHGSVRQRCLWERLFKVRFVYGLTYLFTFVHVIDKAYKNLSIFVDGNVWHCACYTGERSFGDINDGHSNDVTEHTHDDKPRAHVCTVCEKRFRRKSYLKIHKRRHTEANTYTCTQCGKCVSSQHYLRLHMLVHSSKYKCNECGKGCRNNTQLAEHKQCHSGDKPFQCSDCGKRFTMAGNLVKHRSIHSGAKPYNCHVCEKSFSQSGHLNTHMRVHTRDKPYKCHVCDKAFSQLGHLNTHMRVHTGDKPYKCSLCNKSFTTSSSLQSHKHQCVRTSDALGIQRVLL